MFSAQLVFQRDDFSIDTTMELSAGCITALLGSSGSGKTTFMRLIAGLEAPSSGVIISNNRELYNSSTQCCVVPQQRKVGLMFQDYALFNHLTVAENISYGVEKNKQNLVVEQWLKQINLVEKSEEYPNNLSGGEKQRVALARTLACEPEVLLLDEPFSALDMMLRHELRREIQAVVQESNLPVLLATHDLDEARLIADYVCVMDKGKIIRQGEVGEVFRDPQSIAAARTLGWQNLLPLNSTEGNIVFGLWGELQMNQEIHSNPLILGVPENAISLCPQASGISATIIHAVELEKYYLIEVKLKDDTRLIFEQPLGANRIPVGKEVSILIDLQYVKVFYQ